VSSAVVIRAARRDDVPRLGELGALLVQVHHSFDAKRFLAPQASTAHHYGSFLASQLDNPNAIILVAEREGRVIGYGYASLEDYDYMSLRGPAAVLQDLIVEPEARGSGVGGQVLTALLGNLEQRAPRVVLSTADRNESAQRLFERMGFRRTMVEMTRELGGARQSQGDEHE
jgi:ribosomal protein S18 acetylase RimI-like enzyme